MAITLEDVVAFLNENKDDEAVAEYLKTISGNDGAMTPERVLEFLGTDDGKRLVQPMIDTAVTKAVKTRDKAHEQVMEAEVKKRVAAEVLKLNPTEEPWQKEIRELKEANERERTERARDNLKRQIVEEAARMGVEPFWIEDYLPASFEEAKVYLQKIEDFGKKLVSKTTNELVAGGYKPGAGDDKKKERGGPGKPMRRSEYRALPEEERLALLAAGQVVVPD